MGMHDHARAFVENWIAENIQGEPYLDEEGNDPRPSEYAVQCVYDADAAGITEKEIEGAYDSLVDRMAEAIDQSADDEVDRLVAKDRD